MKFINTRQELAKYVNIQECPMVSINIAELLTEAKPNTYIEGDDKLKCWYANYRGTDLYAKGNVYLESESGQLGDMKIYVNNDCVCIHSGEEIWKSEALEMKAESTYRKVKEGDKVVVLLYTEKSEHTFAILTEVGKVNGNVYPCCELKQIED